MDSSSLLITGKPPMPGGGTLQSSGEDNSRFVCQNGPKDGVLCIKKHQNLTVILKRHSCIFIKG